MVVVAVAVLVVVVVVVEVNKERQVCGNKYIAGQLLCKSVVK